MALRSALQQLRSTAQVPLNGVCKAPAGELAVTKNITPFSLDGYDLFDFSDNEFLNDGIPSLSKSTREQTYTQTVCSTQSSQPFDRSITKNPHTSKANATPLIPTTSIPIKDHPQSSLNEISINNPPKTKEQMPASHTGASSLQKLRTFQFVKTRDVPPKATSHRKRPNDDCNNSSHMDSNDRGNEMGSGVPLSKKRAPCDDVTHIEKEESMEDISFGDISLNELFSDVDSYKTVEDRDISPPLFTPTSLQSSQSYNPLLATSTVASRNINQNCMDISSTRTRPSYSQSVSRIVPLQSHSERLIGNISTPSLSNSHSLDPRFKTPISTIRNQRTKHNSGSQISNSSTPNSSPFHTTTKPNPNMYSTPTNKSSVISRHVAGVGTPVGFRTPVSRQPTALVSTPVGDLSTPNIIRTPVTTRRKFPGPAGRLPSLAPGQCMDNISIPPPSTPRPVSTPRKPRLIATRGKTVADELDGSEDCFSDGPWVEMLKDLDVNDQHSSALLQYNISCAINQAASKKLRNGKVTHLRVLLKSIAPAGKNASAVLKDPTGEILCTFHSKVFEDHQKELTPGAALILRQVSMFSPGPRKHYLNITPDNIVRVYPPVSSAGAASPSCGILDLSAIEKMYDSPAPFKKPPHPITRPHIESVSRSSQDSFAHISQRPTHFHPSQRNSQTLTTAPPSTLGKPTTMRNELSIIKQTPAHKESRSTEDSTLELLVESGDFLEEFQDFDDDDDDQLDCLSTQNADSNSSSVGPLATLPNPQASVRTTFFNQLCEDEFDKIFNDMDCDNFDF